MHQTTVDEVHGLLHKCTLPERSDLKNEYIALNKLFDAQVHVPRLLSYNFVDDYHVLDMEYIDGKTLEERLEEM